MKLLIAALLAVFSTNVMAEWTRVSGDDDSTAYADLSTIRKSGDKVKMWEMADFTAAQTVKTPSNMLYLYLSMESQYEYDCKEETSRMLTFIWYSKNMGAGEVIYKSGNIHAEFEPVAPGSYGGILFKVACGKLAPNDLHLNERKTTDSASAPLAHPEPKATTHTDIEDFANWIVKNEALKGTPRFKAVADAFTELDTARGAPSKPVTTDEYAEWIYKNKALKGTPDFETVAQAYREGRAKEIIAGAYYTPKSKNKERGK